MQLALDWAAEIILLQSTNPDWEQASNYEKGRETGLADALRAIGSVKPSAIIAAGPVKTGK